MIVDLDTETFPIAVGLQAPPPVCVQLAIDGGPVEVIHARDPAAHRAVEWALQHTICGHYIAFDMTVICAAWPDLIDPVFDAYSAGRVADTGIREKLRDIADGMYRMRGGYGLDDVASRRLGRTLDKANPWRLRFADLWNVPAASWPAEALAYARDDVAILRPLHDAQGATHEDEPRQCRADFALTLMRCWGVPVDQGRVDRLVAAITTEHQTIGALLRGCGLLQAKRKRDPGGEQKRNMKLAAQWVQQAYESQGLPTPLTEGGSPGTDKTTLAKSGVPELKALGRYGVLNSVLTSAVPLLRQGIIHTRFDLAKTGRSTSSGEGKGASRQGGNAQNFKRDRFMGEDGEEVGIRECIVARPGFVFVLADYSMGELHTWGQVCKDLLGYSRMAEMLIEGLDPHLAFAAQILGITYAEAFTRNEAGDKEVELARQTGKVFNFGSPGGLGPDSLVEYAEALYGVKLTRERAVYFRQLWLHTLPEAKPYFDYINQLTGGQRGGRGTVRQVRSNRIRGGCFFTEACNTLFQGLLADIAKDALYQVATACYAQPSSPLYDSRPVLFGHDEIVCESPLDRASEAGDELGRVMVSAALPWLPDVPCIKAKPAMTRVYSKSAKTKRNGEGRLIEWQP